MENLEKVKIYGLYDPREPDEIRYIGKTINSLKQRLKSHIEESLYSNRKYYKVRWIDKLLKDNVRPSIRLIEEVDYSEWESREIYWISYYRKLGRLTNTTDGGDSGNPSVFSKIISYNLDGNFYKVFNSVQEAVRELGFPRGRINSALQRSVINKRSCKGGDYLWSYYEDDNFPLKINSYVCHKPVPVEVYDIILDKKYIFNSIKECCRELNIKLCGAVNESIKTGRIHKKRYKISKLNKI